MRHKTVCVVCSDAVSATKNLRRIYEIYININLVFLSINKIKYDFQRQHNIFTVAITTKINPHVEANFII